MNTADPAARSGIMKPKLTIHHHGLTSFAFCGRCNGRFGSNLLSTLKAKNDIQEKYANHVCGRGVHGPQSTKSAEFEVDCAPVRESGTLYPRPLKSAPPLLAPS